MDMDLKPNFTPRAQEAIINSKKIAEDLKRRVVTEDHLCLAISRINSLSLQDFYDACGLLREEFEKFCSVRLKEGESKSGKKSYFSSTYKTALGEAVKCAEGFGHDYIGLEHILLSLLDIEECLLSKFLKGRSLDTDQAKLTIRARFVFNEADVRPVTKDSHRQELSTKETSAEKPQQSLKYTVNLNEKAANGKFDKVIGRESEIEDMSEVLCRRSKNNPILLGEPGVGKTAVVEGLAQQIVDSKCTDFLLNKTIYALDLAAMIAGTKYRGQFEERLKKTMEDISKNKNIILFIDEIHTIVGAGSAEGTMDAANILKPVLARGEIMCIGATTRNEYKKTILKDGALDRRFQPILVEEPSQEECIQILNGIKDRYEAFHGVKYPESVIDLSVSLSSRYINDRQLPDKAIDLLDQAGSKAKIRNFQRPKEALNIEDEIAKLYENEKKSSEPHIVIKKRDDLLKKYTKIIEDWAEESSSATYEVCDSDIYEVLTQKTGVPSEEISSTERDKVLNLKKSLSKKVIGQDYVVKKISESILRNKAGFADSSKPIGSFLFLGASGVGKTYLAKQLAESMFGGAKNLIQFDMSEFTEKSSSSKLLGAAPGYVGFDESNSIVDKVKKNPYSVILFDEVEKAHEEVTSLLLQILEEGEISDSSGRTVSFQNCIIILTGNIGSALTKKSSTVGFGASNENKQDAYEKIKEQAKTKLKPELINRIDTIAIFNNFELENIKKITSLELEKFSRRASSKISKIKFAPSIVNYIANKASEENDGARPIKKIIKQEIEVPLAEKILQKNLAQKLTASVSRIKNQTRFKLS